MHPYSKNGITLRARVWTTCGGEAREKILWRRSLES